MRIRQIRIDGFGELADRHIGGLEWGLNVLYGPNEFGKSALLAFIRQVLFGFPAGSPGTNGRLSPSGVPRGGSLVCELDGGGRLTIERTPGPCGGALTVTLDSGERLGQAELNRTLGHITPAFYESVYAIGLDDLRTIRSLQQDEVARRIFGPGLGLLGASLTDVQNQLRAQGESLYTPGGTSQAMPVLYEKIRQLEQAIGETHDGVAQYDHWARERLRLQEQVFQLDARMHGLRAVQRSLQNTAELFPAYLDLLGAEAELSQVGDLPHLPDDVSGQLQQMKTDLAGVQQLLAGGREDLSALQAHRDALTYNERLVGQESSVLALQKSTERYAAASQDIAAAQAEDTSLRESIEKRAARIGKGWTVQRIMDFSLDHLQEDKIRTYRERIEELKAKASSCKTKLELHREEAVVQSLKVFTDPLLYKYGGFAAAGLGLAGFATGLLASNPALTAFSAILLVAGVFLHLKTRAADPMRVSDGLEARLKEELQRAVSDYNRLDKTWHAFLASADLDQSLSPQGALEVANAILQIQSDLPVLDRLDHRIKQTQSVVSGIQKQHDQLVGLVPAAETGGDVCANIEVLMSHLMAAKEAKSQRDALEEQISAQTARVAKLSDAVRNVEHRVQDYLSGLGAADEKDLLAKSSSRVRESLLQEKVDRCRRTLQAAVGAGEAYDRFIESLSATTPQQIQLQLEEAGTQLEGLKLARDEVVAQVGRLEAAIEPLRSRNDLLEKQTEAQAAKQRLRDLSKRWATTQIALVMLAKAVSRYEDARQPQVIKAAQPIFSAITGNRYRAILKPMGGDGLQVRDASGKARPLGQISRGTSEQLYLALRLALIAENETQSESLPVVLDDVLANFDDDRARLAVQALKEFSEDRQVIVLTSHRHLLDLLRRSGAHQIAPSQALEGDSYLQDSPQPDSLCLQTA